MTPGDFPKNQCVKLENISHVTCNDIHSLQFKFRIQFGLQSDSFTCFSKLPRVYQLCQ